MGSRIGFVYEHSSASRTVLVEGDAVNCLSEKLVSSSIWSNWSEFWEMVVRVTWGSLDIELLGNLLDASYPRLFFFVVLKILEELYLLFFICCNALCMFTWSLSVELMTPHYGLLHVELRHSLDKLHRTCFFDIWTMLLQYIFLHSLNGY